MENNEEENKGPEFMEEMLANDFEEYEQIIKGICSYKSGEVQIEDLMELLFNFHFREFNQEKVEAIINEIDLMPDGKVSLFNCILLLKRFIEEGSKDKFQRVVSKKGVGLFRTVIKKQKEKKQYSKNTMKALIKIINKLLKDKEEFQNIVPMDEEDDAACLEKLHDGVVMCTLANIVNNGIIDESTIFKGENLKGLQKLENCKKCLEAATNMGLTFETEPDDIIDKNQEEVQDLLQKILNKTLIDKEILKDNDEIDAVKNEGETNDDVLNLETEELLKRWFNHHLKNAGHPDELTNFNTDLTDSAKYTVLLNQLNGCDLSNLEQPDTLTRATKVLEDSKTLDFVPYIEPQDIVEDNTESNIIFTSQLFNAYMVKPKSDPNEFKRYIKYINNLLDLAPNCSGKLPIDPEDKDIYDKFKDGIILEDLIKIIENENDHYLEPNLFPLPPKGELTQEQMLGSVTRSLEKAKKLGCNAKAVPNDFIQVSKQKIEEIIKELVEKSLIDKHVLKDNPELEILKVEGETNENILALENQVLLKRWFDFYLKKAGKEELANFERDIKSSEKYCILLNQLEPINCDLSALESEDLAERAGKVLENAVKYDVNPSIIAEDILNGSKKLNILFVSQLFNNCLYERSCEEQGDVNLRKAFTKIINKNLGDDETLQGKLPINPENNDLYRKVKDGIILCKIINKVSPGTIYDKAIKIGDNLTIADQIANVNSALSSAKYMGCESVIKSLDIIKKNKKLILELIYEIIKILSFKHINLFDYPQLLRVKQEKEENNELLILPPEDLILRWVNYILKKANYDKKLTNFGEDIKDSEKYIHLLGEICPDKCSKGALEESDLAVRSQKVIENAKYLEVFTFIEPDDIQSGNEKLNLLFLAEIFITNNGFGEATKDEINEVKKLFEDDEEGSREEKVFRSWINTLKLDGVKKVYNLYESCKTGILLLKTIDKIDPGTVNWKLVDLKTKNPYKVLTNCNEVIDAAKRVKYSIVAIGGVNIKEGDKKAILAIVWQLMRRHTLQIIGEKTEEDLLNWGNSLVSPEQKIKNLKDRKLNQSLFFLEILSTINPRAIHWNLVIKENLTDQDKEMNAKYTISLARELGACIFITWEDITQCKGKLLLTFLASLYDLYYQSQKALLERKNSHKLSF